MNFNFLSTFQLELRANPGSSKNAVLSFGMFKFSIGLQGSRRIATNYFSIGAKKCKIFGCNSTAPLLSD